LPNRVGVRDVGHDKAVRHTGAVSVLAGNLVLVVDPQSLGAFRVGVRDVAERTVEIDPARGRSVGADSKADYAARVVDTRSFRAGKAARLERRVRSLVNVELVGMILAGAIGIETDRGVVIVDAQQFVDRFGSLWRVGVCVERVDTLAVYGAFAR
jgi:hypothetical protein